MRTDQVWPGCDFASVNVGKVNNFLVSSCAATAHLSPAPPGPVLEAGSGGGGGGGGGWLAAWPASVLIVGSTAASGCVEQLERCSGQQCGEDTVSLHITSNTSNIPQSVDTSTSTSTILSSESRSKRDGQSECLQRKPAGSSWAILRWRNPSFVRRGTTETP